MRHTKIMCEEAMVNTADVEIALVVCFRPLHAKGPAVKGHGVFALLRWNHRRRRRGLLLRNFLVRNAQKNPTNILGKKQIKKHDFD